MRTIFLTVLLNSMAIMLSNAILFSSVADAGDRRSENLDAYWCMEDITSGGAYQCLVDKLGKSFDDDMKRLTLAHLSYKGFIKFHKPSRKPNEVYLSHKREVREIIRTLNKLEDTEIKRLYRMLFK